MPSLTYLGSSGSRKLLLYIVLVLAVIATIFLLVFSFYGFAEALEAALVVSQIMVLIAISAQAIYTRKAVEQAERSYATQVLGILKPDITAAILSIKIASWALRGISYQLKQGKDPRKCRLAMKRVFEAPHRCTLPTGILKNYAFQTSPHGSSGNLPSTLEALELIKRVATEIVTHGKIAGKIDSVLRFYETLKENEVRVDPRDLDALIDDLDYVANKAESVLLAPTPKPLLINCTMSQTPPSC